MRPLLLALAALFTASSAPAQTVLDPLVGRGTFDTASLAFGATGYGDHIVWVADHDAGIVAVDLTDPDLPTELVSRNTPSFARNIAVSDTLVLVADRFSGLRTYLWRGGTAMGLFSQIDTPGLALSVAVHGTQAVVADKETGLQIVELVDPVNPAIIGTLDTPGFASDVFVEGDLAYVADFDQGVRIVDLTDPAQPVGRGHYPTAGDANGIVVRDGRAYVAVGTGGLLVLDVTDPDLPVFEGGLNPAGTANELALVGDTVLMAAGAAGLQVIDVSDPTAPQLVASWATSSDAYHVASVGPYAALACGAAGLEVVEVFASGATGAPVARRPGLRLLPPAPNPFNPATTLSWIPGVSAGPVTVEIHDLAGRRVRTFGPGAPGSVVWNGRDDQGRSVASGVYTVVVRQGRDVASRKLTLVK